MKRIGLVALALALCQLSHAQTIYSSGAPNLSTVWYADVSNPSAVAAAAEFTLNQPGTINQLSWWGDFTQANVASANDSFQMSIYAAAGSTVGALVATVGLGNAGEKVTGNLIQNSPEYSYDASFSSIALGSGSYFVALQRSGGPGIWGWETANPTAQSLEAYQSAGGLWASNPGVNLAFSLGGTLSPVPEPPASMSVLLGLLALLFLARRQSKCPPQSLQPQR